MNDGMSHCALYLVLSMHSVQPPPNSKRCFSHANSSTQVRFPYFPTLQLSMAVNQARALIQTGNQSSAMKRALSLPSLPSFNALCLLYPSCPLSFWMGVTVLISHTPSLSSRRCLTRSPPLAALITSRADSAGFFWWSTTSRPPRSPSPPAPRSQLSVLRVGAPPQPGALSALAKGSCHERGLI